MAERVDGEWVTRQWLKKAVLLSFRLHANSLMVNGASLTHETGRPMMGQGSRQVRRLGPLHFAAAGFRSVPGAVVRRGAYIGRNVVLMPSFVNIGAFVDEGTMVDTWATVGSCAQIGKHVHLSGGAGIGGVLEPLQANPTIIEDDCFIGARSEVAEGVIVGQGAVLSMGVFISASTKIIDRKTGEVHPGRRAALFGGGAGRPARPLRAGRPSLACAVIVKTRRRADAVEDLDQRVAAGH